MEVVVFGSWQTSRHYIARLNTSVAADGDLSVLFTSPCGFVPTEMYPNSGNRYYAENALEMLDQTGEWYYSRNTETLYFQTQDGGDPNAMTFVIDRGEELKEGILIKEEAARTTTLVPNNVHQSTLVELPPNSVTWGASSFTLEATLLTSRSVGQTIFYKGPQSRQHVPEDKCLYIDTNGHVALDVGWEGHLEPTATFTGLGQQGRTGRVVSRTIRSLTNISDGAPHHVVLAFDAPDSTYSLQIDGEVEGSATFGSADKSPGDWIVALAMDWPKGGWLSGVRYNFSVTEPVQGLHFANIEIVNVGWGLGREDITDFQAVSCFCPINFFFTSLDQALSHTLFFVLGELPFNCRSSFCRCTQLQPQ